MDFTIRTARPEEYAALGDLTARVYLDDDLVAFGAEDPYLDRLRDVAGRAADPGVVILTAEAEGLLLGQVTFAEPGSSMCDIAGPDEAEFRMLAVAPEARGRGVGEALVRACEERARTLPGVRALVLSTTRDMVGAHRIYRRLGFIRTPERDWTPFAEMDPLHTYRLAF
ncbi:GNAT family N-acetyltransferase [Streptomyces sp. BI20]|uniref:GNAT family N-acetyltransferase n=1 Tax=Streptomyces sp. BI20 TaxID=3403460 RepID=UPI003C706623